MWLPPPGTCQQAALDALTGDYYPASARFDRGDWQRAANETGSRCAVPATS